MLSICIPYSSNVHLDRNIEIRFLPSRKGTWNEIDVTLFVRFERLQVVKWYHVPYNRGAYACFVKYSILIATTMLHNTARVCPNLQQSDNWIVYWPWWPGLRRSRIYIKLFCFRSVEEIMSHSCREFSKIIYTMLFRHVSSYLEYFHPLRSLWK